MPLLAEWDSFYGIVGSAAAALVGLQFVAMTLMALTPNANSAVGGAAFGTPTIVHLATPLFLAALIRAPWHSLIPIATLWALVGLGGLAYSLIIAARMFRLLQRYQPVFEDWLFHLALPIVAYAGLIASAFAVLAFPADALFGLAAAVLLLLLVGIHNAWDNVDYQIYVNLPKLRAEAENASRRGE